MGEWKKSHKMQALSASSSPFSSEDNDFQMENRKIFTLTFDVYRGKKKIHYYYMKRS